MRRLAGVTRRLDVERSTVQAGCAISCGVHVGLVPEHWDEVRVLAVAFAIAAAALAATAALVVLRPRDVRVPRFAALLLGALIIGYAASRTTGLPVPHAERESLDAVGVATQAVEAAALLAALALSHSERRTA
jgi:hypothetical protein